MKPLFLKAFLLFSLFSMHVLHSQNLTDKDLYKLKGLNINTKKTDLNDYNVRLNLNKILDLDYRRKTNKTFAITFSTLSAASLLLGGALISQKKKGILGDIFGGLFITLGVIKAGVSIPFWVSFGKRKKERDRLINSFKD